MDQFILLQRVLFFTLIFVCFFIGPSHQRLHTEQTSSNSIDFSVIICAIALGEDAYVDEWAQYHLLLGFNGIQIFDNSVNNTLRDLPSRFPDASIGVVHFPGMLAQLPAYSECVKLFNNQQVWAAFIDIDEFIVLRQHDTIHDLVRNFGYRPIETARVIEVLPQLENRNEETAVSSLTNVSAISLNWLLFGSSNMRSAPAAGDYSVLHRFTLRSNRVSRSIKSIAYLPNVLFMGPHCPVPRMKYKFQIDCNGRNFAGVTNPRGDDSIAAVHHYAIKSFEEFGRKRPRGKGDRAISIATNKVVSSIEDTEEVAAIAAQSAATKQPLLREMHYPIEFFHKHDENIVQDMRAWEQYNRRLLRSKGVDAATSDRGYFSRFYELLQYPDAVGGCGEVLLTQRALIADSPTSPKKQRSLQWCVEDDLGMRLVQHCIDEQLLSHERCVVLQQHLVVRLKQLPEAIKQLHGITDDRIAGIRKTAEELFEYYRSYELNEWQRAVLQKLHAPINLQQQLSVEADGFAGISPTCHAFWQLSPMEMYEEVAENATATADARVEIEKEVLPQPVSRDSVQALVFVISTDSRAHAHLISSTPAIDFTDFLAHESCAENHSMRVRPRIIGVLVENSSFGEYAAYRDVFAEEYLVKLQPLEEYVVISSFDTFLSISSFCGSEYMRLLGIGRQYDYDVIPLVRSRRSLMVAAVFNHTRRFWLCWNRLLQSFGYTPDRIREFDHMKPFYRNAMILRPAWFLRLSKFMKHAMVTINQDQELAVLFKDFDKSDMNRNGSVDNMRRDASQRVNESATSVTQEEAHPLYLNLVSAILERLPSFFLAAEGARICHANDLCPYTTSE